MINDDKKMQNGKHDGIISIKIKEHQILKNFKWEEIPQFALITGVNGSGKTKLLEHINFAISNNRNNQGLEFGTSVPIPPEQVFYKQVYAPPAVFVAKYGAQEDENTKTSLQNIIQSYHQQLKGQTQSPKQIDIYTKNFKKIKEFMQYTFPEKKEEFEDNGTMMEALWLIEQNKISNLIANFVKDSVPDVNKIDNINISAIFVAYYKAQESFQARAFRERQNNEWVAQQLKERFGVEKAPWDWINEQLEKYEFKHKVKPAMDGSYELAFEGSTVKYEQLSSGEKVIFHLICSAYNGNGSVAGKTKLLLLDEFDAHLNPTMAQMFVAIIENVLVKQFQMQVIATTHSPSTVAYTKEENLFWMEGIKTDENSPTEYKICKAEDRDSGKMGIIHTLSTGFVETTCPFMSYLVDLTKPYYIIVEGYTDIMHIQTACKKLGGNYLTINQKCNFLHLNGIKDAKSVDVFVKNFNGGKEMKVCVIVDNDKSGNEYYKINTSAIRLKSDNKEDYKDQIDKYIPIEFLYKKEKINKYIVTKGVTEDKEWTQKIKEHYIGADNISNKDALFYLDMKQEQKKEFAESVKDFDLEDFKDFKPTLDLVLTQITKWDTNNQTT